MRRGIAFAIRCPWRPKGKWLVSERQARAPRLVHALKTDRWFCCAGALPDRNTKPGDAALKNAFDHPLIRRRTTKGEPIICPYVIERQVLIWCRWLPPSRGASEFGAGGFINFARSALASFGHASRWTIMIAPFSIRIPALEIWRPSRTIVRNTRGPARNRCTFDFSSMAKLSQKHHPFRAVSTEMYGKPLCILPAPQIFAICIQRHQYSPYAACAWGESVGGYLPTPAQRHARNVRSVWNRPQKANSVPRRQRHSTGLFFRRDARRFDLYTSWVAKLSAQAAPEDFFLHLTGYANDTLCLYAHVMVTRAGYKITFFSAVPLVHTPSGIFLLAGGINVAFIRSIQSLGRCLNGSMPVSILGTHNAILQEP